MAPTIVGPNVLAIFAGFGACAEIPGCPVNDPAVIARQLCMHFGTRKTGTKALQVFLAMNRVLLEKAGVQYPIAGRLDMGDGYFTPGHHKVAMELLSDGISPTLYAMLDEIDMIDCPTVVLSSEEFQTAINRPATMATLAQEFRARNYDIRPIVYVRAQPYYAESLFAELAKGGYNQSLESFYEMVLTNGYFDPPGSNRAMHLVYSHLAGLLDQFADPGASVVRAYHPEREPEYVFNDFLRTIGKLRGALRIDGLTNPLPRTNESLTFSQLLEAIYKIIATTNAKTIEGIRPWLVGLPEMSEDTLNARFSLLTRDDMENFLERFDADNRAVNAQYGIDIPFTGPEHLPTPEDPRFALARIHRDVLTRAMEAWNAV